MIITDLVNDPAGYQRETDSQGRHWGPYLNLNGEYVEIQNNSSLGHEISGWRVRDQDGHTYVFPVCEQLAPGASVRLLTGTGTDTATSFHWNRKAPVWNNPGDKASLVDTSGEVVSEFATRQRGATLSGHVYVSGTQNGVAGADILYVAEVNPGASGTSDSSGAYSMQVDPGLHRLQASALGYADSAIFSHVFGLNEAMDHPFELSPSGSPGTSVIDVGVSYSTPASVEWNSPMRVRADFQNNGVVITSFVASLDERPVGGGDGDWVTVDDVVVLSAHGSGDTWPHTFTVPAKTWDWNPGSYGFIAVGETERRYEYRVTCTGERQTLSSTQYSDVRGVPVRVGDSKVDAADTYNAAMVALIVGVSIAVAGIVIAAFPAAAGVAVTATARVISALVGATGLLTIQGANATRGGASLTMSDPISLSGLYSKVVRPVVSRVTTQSQNATRVAGVALCNGVSTVAGYSQAALECRDRLATATLHGAQSLIAKQERKLQEFKDVITASVNQLDQLRDQVLAGLGADFGLSTAQFAQIRSYLAANPVPPAVVTKLTNAGLSAAEVEECRQAILHANLTANQLKLAGALDPMIASVRRDVGHLFTELERVAF